MNKKAIFATAIFALVASGNACAMTTKQAQELARDAYKGNMKALRQLEHSADNGDGNAQFWIGSYYAAKKNYKKMIYWRTKDAEKGSANAEYQLAMAYEYGIGVHKSFYKAEPLAREAFNKGIYPAAKIIARYYLEKNDNKKVEKWFKIAACLLYTSPSPRD